MTAVAEVVVGASDLDATVTFFVERLGFRVLTVIGADKPRVVVVGGSGLRLRLDRELPEAPLWLRVAQPGGGPSLIAPNGIRIEVVDSEPALEIPPLRTKAGIVRAAGDAWVVGRAGMRYRDLIPDRAGGYVIASQIRIDTPGPVPDYVHFHRIDFQMIFVARGWVRLVYEDQGAPFVMGPGDCVLQPPQIRHRVLESSGDLEVFEVAVPAEHETHADPTLVLPTVVLRPGRDYHGQRFVQCRAEGATWGPWRHAGFVARDTGIGAATDGRARVLVVRGGEGPSVDLAGAAALRLAIVVAGAVTADVEGEGDARLHVGDVALLPAG